LPGRSQGADTRNAERWWQFACRLALRQSDAQSNVAGRTNQVDVYAMRLVAFTAIFACAAATAIAAEQIPKYNPASMCNAWLGRAKNADASFVNDLIKSCIDDERENLLRLKKEYTRYRPELFRECANMSGMMGYCLGLKSGSYRVLLNCLREGKMPDELWRNVKCTPGKVNKIEFTGPPPEKKAPPRGSPSQSGR
jgi:hypothetical protein